MNEGTSAVLLGALAVITIVAIVRIGVVVCGRRRPNSRANHQDSRTTMEGAESSKLPAAAPSGGPAPSPDRRDSTPTRVTPVGSTLINDVTAYVKVASEPVGTFLGADISRTTADLLMLVMERQQVSLTEAVRMLVGWGGQAFRTQAIDGDVLYVYRGDEFNKIVLLDQNGRPL